MSGIMGNATFTSDLPPLPSYTLKQRPSILPGISDTLLQLLAPVVAYWVVSLFFHILDTYDIFSQYRLHTPAEVLKRNRVTRYEVVRDVVLQQIIQTFTGLAISVFDPETMTGREQYDIAVWAQRLRIGQGHLPSLLAMLGLDAIRLSSKIHETYPTLASVLSGGNYPHAMYSPWELLAAQTIYHVLVPAAQFLIAIFIVDTWQYFLHRAMHMNKFLYTTLHSRHHRLYVPYAFGALYNHPLEGFLLDSLGTGLAYMITGMSTRQGIWFFTCSTIKTVDDHCGYAFPWDPLQHITSNNAAYHDVHHQSWGIKTNFSQPFFTFWDRLLGTVWSGGDVSARYERERIAAQRKTDDHRSRRSSVTNSPAVDIPKASEQLAASQMQVLDDKDDGGSAVVQEEQREEREVREQLRRTRRSRKSGSSFDAPNLKGLSDRVAGSLHGRGVGILHADGVH